MLLPVSWPSHRLVSNFRGLCFGLSKGGFKQPRLHPWAVMHHMAASSDTAAHHVEAQGVGPRLYSLFRPLRDTSTRFPPAPRRLSVSILGIARYQSLEILAVWGVIETH